MLPMKAWPPSRRAPVALVALLLLLGASRGRCQDLRSLVRAVREKGTLPLEETGYGDALLELPAAKLHQRLEAIQEVAIRAAFSRPLSHRPVRAAPEEGGLPRALLTLPEKGEPWKGVRDYVRGRTQTRGARSFRKTLVWRRRARLAKLAIYLRTRRGLQLRDLSDADLASLREDETFRWLLHDVFEPVAVLLMERPSFGTGPASGAMPSLRLVPRKRLRSPELGEVEGFATAPDGRFLVDRIDSMLILEDQEPILIQDMLLDDTLGGVLGHETLHGLMGDLQPGGSAVGPSTSLVPHQVHAVTDRKMAFSEGFAEVFEGIFGEDREDLFEDGEPGSVERLFVGRQEALRRNRYVQAGYRKYHHTTPTGSIETGARMVASEGVVAGVLYRLFRHRVVGEAAAPLVFRALYLDQPQDFMDFLRALARHAPTPESRAAILRTFLHETRFATVSHQAWKAYQEARETTLAFKRTTSVEDPERPVRLQASRRARAAYEKLAGSLEARVLAGELPLDAVLGPELWCDGQASVGPPTKDGSRPRGVFRYDLNAIGPRQLRTMGLSEAGIAALLEHRWSQGFLEAIEPLASLLPPEDYEKIREARETYRREGSRTRAMNLPVLE